ncbi:MAG: hypothetical protein HY748_00145 [Elusimicrobia bacterium]|nr:hypothetical protein [Elusimicrobiota bacterium]
MSEPKDLTRMLRCFLRGAVDREDLRTALAKDLGRELRDIVALDPESPHQPEAPIYLEYARHDCGFELEVALCYRAAELPRLKNSLELAGILSRRFRQDVLAFRDPLGPDSLAPATHGLLLRSDGMAYRVPIIRMEKGVDIPDDIHEWEPWLSGD